MKKSLTRFLATWRGLLLIAIYGLVSASSSLAQASDTILYSFQGGSDGSSPEVGLVRASDGNFYGTTALGGSHSGGTIYEITPSGSVTPMYSFGNSDHQVGSLVQDVNDTPGFLYGVTYNSGTIYKIQLPTYANNSLCRCGPTWAQVPTQVCSREMMGIFMELTEWVLIVSTRTQMSERLLAVELVEPRGQRWLRMPKIISMELRLQVETTALDQFLN